MEASTKGNIGSIYSFEDFGVPVHPQQLAMLTQPKGFAIVVSNVQEPACYAQCGGCSSLSAQCLVHVQNRAKNWKVLRLPAAMHYHNDHGAFEECGFDTDEPPALPALVGEVYNGYSDSGYDQVAPVLSAWPLPDYSAYQRLCQACTAAGAAGNWDELYNYYGEGLSELHVLYSYTSPRMHPGMLSGAYLEVYDLMCSMIGEPGANAIYGVEGEPFPRHKVRDVAAQIETKGTAMSYLLTPAEIATRAEEALSEVTVKIRWPDLDPDIGALWNTLSGASRRAWKALEPYAGGGSGFDRNLHAYIGMNPWY